MCGNVYLMAFGAIWTELRAIVVGNRVVENETIRNNKARKILCLPRNTFSSITRLKKTNVLKVNYTRLQRQVYSFSKAFVSV